VSIAVDAVEQLAGDRLAKLDGPVRRAGRDKKPKRTRAVGGATVIAVVRQDNGPVGVKDAGLIRLRAGDLNAHRGADWRRPLAR
jgi:hypothetical protein